jgi:chromosome segregation ATPase
MKTRRTAAAATAVDTIKRQAKVAKLQQWNSNPAQSAVMQAMERALISLDIQELRESAEATASDLEEHKTATAKMDRMIHDVNTTIDNQAGQLAKCQKMYEELHERSTAVEKSLEALARADEDLLKRMDELRSNSEQHSSERTSSEVGDLRARLSDLDCRLMDITRLVKARQKLIGPYLNRTQGKFILLTQRGAKRQQEVQLLTRWGKQFQQPDERHRSKPWK